ncbi:phosphotransferase [Bradyrhizobium niftali]|uniref:phosphotransferase n=1 Tax=Bradyrhizobium niftali TaxID=2560055 RepID=UPI00384D593E
MADGVRKDEEFSGTKPVEERHRFDELRLEAWMRDNVEGYEGPLVVLQFKGGQSNPTYRLNTPKRSYVMRRKPFGKLLPSAHAVDREYRVIAALGKQGFPVARAYALLPGRQHHRRRLLHHVDGGRPGVLGSDAAEPDAGRSPQDLHQQDRDAGKTPHVRSRRDRPR